MNTEISKDTNFNELWCLSLFCSIGGSYYVHYLFCSVKSPTENEWVLDPVVVAKVYGKEGRKMYRQEPLVIVYSQRLFTVLLLRSHSVCVDVGVYCCSSQWSAMQLSWFDVVLLVLLYTCVFFW